MTVGLMRLGLPSPRGGLGEGFRRHGWPCLVSAAALWTGKGWRYPVAGLDAALDSGAFGAAKAGGYQWTASQYREVVEGYPWAWVASMDVLGDTDATIEGHRATGFGIPVLQGSTLHDYARCAAALLPGEELFGIGSLVGASAARVASILETVRPFADDGARCHLFGVKSRPWWRVWSDPMVLSSDSCAWDYRARAWCREAGVSYSHETRLHFAGAWLARQEGRASRIWPPGQSSAQVDLFGGA